MIEENKIYNIDCIDGLIKLDDNSIDCIIIDPPYSGLTAKSKGEGRYSQEEYHISFDDMSERAFLLFIKPILLECYRILKLGGHMYCFSDWKQLRNMADSIELSSFKIVNLICWNKGHFGTGSGYRSQAEYVLVFAKGLPNKFNLKNVGNVITCKRSNNKLHPHEKPRELIDIFISNSTKKGDIILDCFMGSGTTAVSSKHLNRRFVGFELSKEYCDIAERRINDTEVSFDIDNMEVEDRCDANEKRIPSNTKVLGILPNEL